MVGAAARARLFAFYWVLERKASLEDVAAAQRVCAAVELAAITSNRNAPATGWTGGGCRAAVLGAAACRLRASAVVLALRGRPAGRL